MISLYTKYRLLKFWVKSEGFNFLGIPTKQFSDDILSLTVVNLFSNISYLNRKVLVCQPNHLVNSIKTFVNIHIFSLYHLLAFCWTSKIWYTYKNFGGLFWIFIKKIKDCYFIARRIIVINTVLRNSFF